MAALQFFKGTYSAYVDLAEKSSDNLYFTIPDETPDVEAKPLSDKYCLFHGEVLIASSKFDSDITAIYNSIQQLNERIDSISNELATYEIKKVEDGLSENVKEAYALFKITPSQEEGGEAIETQVGETIKIYKDSALQNVELIGQELVFTHLLDNGTTKETRIDVSNFLAESEFANGLQVNDGVVSVKAAAAAVAQQTPTKDAQKNFVTVDENGVAVKSVDTDATVLQKDIRVAGLSTQFGAGNYNNNDTIAAGTDIYTILQNILCKELYAEPSYTTGTIQASIGQPTITLDKTGVVEVGTLITMTTARVGDSTVKSTGHSVSNLTYGYSAENDNSQDTSATIISTSWTTNLTGGQYKMTAALTGFTADNETNKQKIPAAVSAQTMSATTLGCAVEGSNSIKINVTGDTYTGSIDGIDSVYHCSNLGNTSAEKKTNAINAITSQKSNAPTNNKAVTVTGKYKYFMGYSEKQAYSEFDSDSVRALSAFTDWVEIDNTTTIIGNNTEKSNGQSIIIACPNKYQLATIENNVGSMMPLFHSPENYKDGIGSDGVVTVKCGEINVDYHVYVYAISNNVPVEFKNVTLTKKKEQQA